MTIVLKPGSVERRAAAGLRGAAAFKRRCQKAVPSGYTSHRPCGKPGLFVYDEKRYCKEHFLNERIAGAAAATPSASVRSSAKGRPTKYD